MASDYRPSSERDLDPTGFGREPVHGSTYDRGGYGRETESGRSYPGSRGRREAGSPRGPYMPGPADTGYGQHETASDPRGPAGYEPGGYGLGPDSGRPSAPRGYERRGYEGGRYEEATDAGDGGSWDVPGPHAGRGPRGYERSDERIMEDVCERLTWHGQIDASAMRVSVEDREVTLEDTIDSRRTKRLADDVAASVRGVHDVHNHLRIARSDEESV